MKRQGEKAAGERQGTGSEPFREHSDDRTYADACCKIYAADTHTDSYSRADSYFRSSSGISDEIC